MSLQDTNNNQVEQNRWDIVHMIVIDMLCYDYLIHVQNPYIFTLESHTKWWFQLYSRWFCIIIFILNTVLMVNM